MSVFPFIAICLKRRRVRILYQGTVFVTLLNFGCIIDIIAGIEFDSFGVSG